jgi:hypothetical protein
MALAQDRIRGWGFNVELSGYAIGHLVQLQSLLTYQRPELIETSGGKLGLTARNRQPSDSN